MMKTHPNFDEIRAALEPLPKKGKLVTAVCYRCTQPEFVPQIVSGLGSQIHGGRRNPKNSFPAIYLCETAEAALQEYLARGRRMKLPDHKSLPMVMAAVNVRASNVLDITDSKIATIIAPLLAKDKIHWRAIQHRREAASQAVGRALHDVCFSGLIAPSPALPGSRNLILFPQKLLGSDVLSSPKLNPLL